MDKYNAAHRASVEAFSKRVRKAYLQAVKDFAKVGKYARLDSAGNLIFVSQKTVNSVINPVINTLYETVYAETVTGINTNWELAVERNNALAYSLYGASLDELPNAYKTKYLSNNQDALRRFVERKDNGFTVSDKVWANTEQFRDEMKLGIETALKRGTSATKLASELTQYLNEPDKLFRRVKDASGELGLSKAAKDYHPGQGVYRSSYKNAIRLTGTEIGASYETSAQEKRKQQDFIVGVEIRVSPRHKASDDGGGISCLTLQGKYPKDFDFAWKWHPKCRCMSLNIVKTQDEIWKDIDRIGEGGEPDTPSINAVDKIPKSYVDYTKENAEKWGKYKNPPRFYANNAKK